MKLLEPKYSALPDDFGEFVVFPTCARFDGRHGLRDAIRWAELCAAWGGRFTIVNEWGTTVGVYEGRLLAESC